MRRVVNCQFRISFSASFRDWLQSVASCLRWWNQHRIHGLRAGGGIYKNYWHSVCIRIPTCLFFCCMWNICFASFSIISLLFFTFMTLFQIRGWFLDDLSKGVVSFHIFLAFISIIRVALALMRWAEGRRYSFFIGVLFRVFEAWNIWNTFYWKFHVHTSLYI